MKKVFLALGLIGALLSLTACPATTIATTQTTEYKTVGAAQDGANVALAAYEAEFEAHLTTPAQDAAVTSLHRKFEAAVIAVAQANIAFNDAVAAGKSASDLSALSAAVATATQSAISAGTDLVNFINALKK